MDLAAALSRIDNFDFDSLREETNDIRKKLHFNDSNSDEYEDDIRQELELKVKIKNNTNNITCMQTQTLIPLQELNKNIYILRTNNCVHDVCLEEKDNKRRSTRSVKFSGIEKEQNEINKPTLSITPYIKKRKISSKTNEKNNTLIKNSSEISKKQRIRRSQNKKI
ncbi:disks large-associated protein 5 [Apis mellifera caucasica]|nr:disks large-associated protein 5 [Apis mellifera caucasica]KAG9429095.1 disks large-associated protein 5 [Apis mellifera carnica]